MSALRDAAGRFLPVPVADRFWSNIREEDRGFETPCWIWQGCKNSKGYGWIKLSRNKLEKVHRAVFEIVLGEPIPDDKESDHLCHQRDCVNPFGHIEPVDHRENLERRRYIARNFTKKPGGEILEANKRQAAAWASNLLAAPDGWCILDTETTGLSPVDQVVEVSVLAPDETVLFNSRVKADCPIEPDAEAIHHISKAVLENAPTFEEIWPNLVAAIGSRRVVTYNKKFDARMLYQTGDACGNDISEAVREFFRDRWQRCAMEMYAGFIGKWNAFKGSYRWQPLPGGDHSALGDCRATLAVIKEMAKAVEA
jgi:DNA polymerase-3 subunit epsilon